MKKKLHLPFLVLIMLCATTFLGAQKLLYKANKQFDLKHYSEAIETYKKFLEDEPENLTAKSNLAEAYRMTNQLPLAVEAYAKIMPEEYVDPVHIRNYGITLMKMAEYNKAHYQFEIYKIYNPVDAQHYQLSCEYAHHLYRKEQSYEVELVGVNTVNSDFGVAFWGEDMVFSSFRNDVELSDDAKQTGQELTGNMLYIAEVDADLRADNVKFLRSGIAEKRNIGPISFAPEAEICAFTRNKIQNGGAHVTGDDSYHSIYIADLTGSGEWANERPFRYNEFGTSTGFPSLAFDGSALYFSSNRVGGYGGYDIYVSYWKENVWTYPENLGPEINTPGNEITPFFTDSDLYFSSDYHHGMGGYDILHSKVVGGKWSHPNNLANGVNSPADDYYPVIKPGTDGIFFSSNRLGGRGMDDIYLAMPVGDKELASLEVVPEAVPLTVMESRIESTMATNPQARVVSLGDPIKREGISSGTRDPEALKNEDPNAELPLWGFAGVPEKKVAKSHEPRPLIAIEKIKTSDLKTLTYQDNWTSLGDNIAITIIEYPNGTLNDHFIAAYESEEVEDVIIEGAELEPAIDSKEEEIVIADSEEETPTTEVFEEEVATNDEAVQVAEEIIEVEREAEVENQMEDVIAFEEKPEVHKIPNYKAISASRAPLNLDIAGAKRVAIGELLPASEVYFIQLAALTKSSGNVDHFKNLSKYGNLYKVFKSTSTKIKLGYFLDKSEASKVLKNVKSNGFKDAFITKDDLGSVQLELIIANDQQTASYDSYSSNTTNYGSTDEYTLHNPGRKTYKIRLASYEDPIWFDIDKAKSLGNIEQWTKGNWTIFLLGGYATHDDAEQARIKAVNKGFQDAEIVIDNNGILVRLKDN